MIDTHHHFLPKEFAQSLQENGLKDAGGRKTPDWSPESSLEIMDRNRIDTAIVSISTPGVHFGNDAAARKLARTLNERGAELGAAHPGRFGFFAVLTLPDVDGAIDEANYALDALGADGVILLANTHGTYLGDPAFDRLFDALDERQTVVFVHPSELPGPPVPGIPEFAVDFMLDTSRAAIKLITSGTLERCPRLKIILSHAGGFIPYVSYRIAPVIVSDRNSESGLSLLRRFYFDLAISSSPAALPSLLAFADREKITYGSDFPYAYPEVVDAMCGHLAAYPLNDTDRHRLERGNAERLFPRFSAVREVSFGQSIDRR